ncbi:Unknown protein sequence [Pseudomonas amygdali pv. lachrymans]|nr:Unknown protein sequence [Pseudomonas amygdali pv. lachrymans]
MKGLVEVEAGGLCSFHEGLLQLINGAMVSWSFMWQKQLK